MDPKIILSMSVFALNFLQAISVKVGDSRALFAPFSVFVWAVALWGLALSLLHERISTISSEVLEYALYATTGSAFAALLVLCSNKVKTKLSSQKQFYYMASGGAVQLFGMFVAIFLLVQYPGSEWLGAGIALPGAILMLYATFAHYPKNASVLVAEVFFIALWTLIFIKLAGAELFVDRVANALILLVITLFGVILGSELRKESADRKEVEGLAEQLHKANAVLLALDRQKSEFISVASHQLRTPITSIKGYASMLVENSFGVLSQQSLNAMKKIYSASETLATLVEDFLTVSRIEQGQLSYQAETVHIESLVREVVEEVRPLAVEKGLGINIKIASGGVPTVFVDYKKIKQALRNILDYSVKNTDEGFITVFISPDKERGKMVVSVSDTGKGISKESLASLFTVPEDPKQWLDSSLGLFVAHEIIQAHGGVVRAESKGVEQGATFFIELNTT